MFSKLSTGMKDAFGSLSGRTTLTKQDVENSIEEVKRSLIDADVALPVVKKFISEVQEEAIGSKVKDLPKLDAFEEIVKKKLTKLLGDDIPDLNLPKHQEIEVIDDDIKRIEKRIPMSSILVTGIQGAGKTTTSAKLANRLKNQKISVMLVSLDTHRPAAQEQLEILANKANILSLPIVEGETPIEISKRALQLAKLSDIEIIIFDSAGRMHVDDELMNELQSVKEIIKPCETLLVADSMLGNDSVNISKEFKEKVDITGIIITRLDGDTKGGSTISMKEVTGVPIKFVGTGENLEDLDKFIPEGMASRILGSTDILSLKQKTQEIMEASDLNETKVKKLEKKMKSGNFDFEIYTEQLNSLKKAGNLQNFASFIPGLANMQTGQMNTDFIDVHLRFINLMTEKEKRNPNMFKQMASCRIGLAKRAKVPVVEVNKFLKMFEKLKETFSKFGDLTDPQNDFTKMIQNNPKQFMKTVKVKPGHQPTLFGRRK
eukprot:gene7598-11921_t